MIMSEFYRSNIKNVVKYNDRNLCKSRVAYFSGKE